MAKPKRNRTGLIVDLAQRRSSFTKRRNTIFKRASELSERNDAAALVVLESSIGKISCCSYPSGKMIKNKKTRGKGLTKWEEHLIKEECDSCTTEEELLSIIAKKKAYIVFALERLDALKNNPSVGGDSGVLMDYSPGTSPDEELEFICNPDAYRSRFGTPEP